MRSTLKSLAILALAASPLSMALAGDKPKDVEFKTVCGVSTPEETSRDTCLVVDYYHGDRKTQTDLNFPDFGIVLIWQEDNKVDVGSEGEEWGVQEWSTSEGETRFTVGRMTYYYVSDQELAERELSN